MIGNYWSSTLSNEDDLFAFATMFNLNDSRLESAEMERRLGCAVRLVKVVSDDDYIVGDANNDGKVDAADIVFVVSYINGKSLPGFNEKAANADGNGKIDENDVFTIEKIILSTK